MQTPQKSQLTVVETIYFQEPDRQPTVVESRFNRQLESNEQPYARVMKLNEDWKTLDCGWIEQVGMVVLINEEGYFRRVNPTEEERGLANAKVIEIDLNFRNDENALLIPPKESLRFFPKKKTLRLRCQHGEARCNVTVFPV